MPKYDVPIVVQVECADLEAARRTTYELLEKLTRIRDVGGVQDDAAELVPANIDLSIANDEITIDNGKRIVLLHPADTDAEYDPIEYQKTHVKSDEEE